MRSPLYVFTPSTAGRSDASRSPSLSAESSARRHHPCFLNVPNPVLEKPVRVDAGGASRMEENQRQTLNRV